MRHILSLLLLPFALLGALISWLWNPKEYPPLPENPIIFESYEFTNPNDPDDGYMAIDWNGRAYIGYGTLSAPLHADDLEECIGCLSQEGILMEDVLFFTLADDPEHNFLMDYATEGFMEQPYFYRAIDTVGQDIHFPRFIDHLDYDYWNQ